jgi:hypothetical protein
MRLTCRGEGCQASIEVGNALPFATYTCKNHVAKKGDDKIRFQESQFDPKIGSGTDPKAYERGHAMSRSSHPAGSAGSRASKKKSMEKVEKALVGHENREQIISILKKDNAEDNS